MIAVIELAMMRLKEASASLKFKTGEICERCSKCKEHVKNDYHLTLEYCYGKEDN
jgi:hypothetical protein